MQHSLQTQCLCIGRLFCARAYCCTGTIPYSSSMPKLSSETVTLLDGDIRVFKVGWTEDQQTELKETIESSDDWWDWLMENGFEPQECETYICGMINIEKIDHLPWDAPE